MTDFPALSDEKLREIADLVARLQKPSLGRGHASCQGCDDVLKEDAADAITSLLDRALAAEGALERWVDARRVILTFDGNAKTDGFKAAWHELGEAEWALAALLSPAVGVEGLGSASPQSDTIEGRLAKRSLVDAETGSPTLREPRS